MSSLWHDRGLVRSDAQLAAVLRGDTDLRDAPPAIQSWARLQIYRGACSVLTLPTVDARRAALARLPPLIRPYVEAETRRVWAMRRGSGA